MRFRIELEGFCSKSEAIYSPSIQLDDYEPLYVLYKNDYDFFGEWDVVIKSHDLDMLKSIAEKWKEFKTINV